MAASEFRAHFDGSPATRDQLDEIETHKKQSEDAVGDLKEELETLKADLRVQREHYENK